MSDSREPLAALVAAPAPPAACPAARDARLWVPADLLYSLRMAAGTPVLVGSWWCGLVRCL